MNSNITFSIPTIEITLHGEEVHINATCNLWMKTDYGKQLIATVTSGGIMGDGHEASYMREEYAESQLDEISDILVAMGFSGSEVLAATQLAIARMNDDE